MSKEELAQLYIRQKLTDQQIADTIGQGATVKRVRSWRRRFGIATILPSMRRNVSPIEGDLKSLLIGSMLGDGRLNKIGRSTRYIERHGEAQLAYLQWKVEQWGADWSTDNGIQPVHAKLKGKPFLHYRYHTGTHPSLNEWHSLFYPARGPKRLTPGVVDLVDLRALAIWYLDDGTAAWWPIITFGMSLESRDLALAILRRFGLNPRWLNRKRRTGDFIFEGEVQAEHFIALVAPYVPECMRSKLTFGFQGSHYQVRKAAPQARLRELTSQGYSIKAMAKLLGVGSTTVSRYLKQFGITHARTIGRPRDRRAA